MEKKGISIRRIIDWCIVVGILIFTGFQIVVNHKFTNTYLDFLSISDDRYETQKSLQAFLDTSERLHYQVQHYALSHEAGCIDSYFRELYAFERERQLYALQSEDNGDDLIQTVRDMVSSQTEKELHVFKLGALADSIPESQMNYLLREYTVPADEAALSAQEKWALAYEIAFSSDYFNTYDKLNILITDYAEKLIDKSTELTADYIGLIRGRISTQQTLYVLALIMLLFMVFILYRQMTLNKKMHIDEQEYKDALIANALGALEINLTEDRIEAILSEKSTDLLKNEFERLQLASPYSFSEFISQALPLVSPVDAKVLERISPAFFINQFNEDVKYLEQSLWYSVNGGRHIFVNISMLLSQRPDTSAVCALLVFRDKTKEKLEQEKQQRLIAASMRSEQQYLDALRTDTIGIYEINVTRDLIQRIITDTNDHRVAAFFETLNIPLPGKYSQYEQKITELMDESYRKEYEDEDMLSRLKMYEKGVRNVYNEFWITTPAGGHRFITRTILLRKDSETDDVIGLIILRDGTQQQLEYERYRYEQMQQKAVIDARNEFFSCMSHDILTPLNGIVGMIDLARHHVDDPRRVLDCVEKMDQSSKHLLSLINDFLDMSRIDSGSVSIIHEPMNLSMIQEECSIIVRSQILLRDIELKTDRSAFENPNVLGDAPHLKQILLGLLNNAVKFTRDGGTISLSAESEYNFDATKLQVTYTVRNTSSDMSEEMVARLFEPFARDSAHYQGTGLGLTLVKRYLDLMEGTVTVDNSVPDETTITVKIAFDINVDVDDYVPAGSRVDIKGLKILLVDDNELNTEIVQLLLEDQGAVVEAVSDGQQAVDRYGSRPEGYFDAIIMDIMMPVMDGNEATKVIRRMTRSDAGTIPIIALTANTFGDNRKMTEQAGMTAHLTKPIVPAMLMETLTRCCRVH